MENTPKYHEQTIRIENDIFKILENVNPVYRVAVVNMALRTFINTDTFRYYFNADSENTNINSDPGMITQNVTQNVTLNAVPNTQQVMNDMSNSVAQTPKKPTTSWDDF